MHRLSMAVVPIALLAVSARALAAPGDVLDSARNHYQFGDYKTVIDKLEPLLAESEPQKRLLRTDDVVEARRLLGLAYLFEKSRIPEAEAKAEREFLALLSERPDAELDPLVDPPPFVEFFTRLKARFREKLDAVRLQLDAQERGRAAAEESRRVELANLRLKVADLESSVYLVDSAERSRLVALVPFGAGQFQNGHTGKGIFFMTSEVVLGAASVAFAATVRLRWADGTFAPGERDQAETLVGAQVLTGAAFVALALWGVIDANLSFEPARQSAPRRVPKDSLHLGANAEARNAPSGER
ncbi:MAG: hypothetical protein AABZ30_13425 [Myxococcota bacterium]|mgnify:CR=1 FL=1